MTVSAGIANLSTGDTMASLTQRADEALYQAKAAGRDQIHVAPNGSVPETVEIDVSADFVQLIWHPAYECGNVLIDRQHENLFVLANTLLTAILTGKSNDDVSALIDTLIGDVVTHFKDEEAMLAEAGFADLEGHAILHQQLVDRAAELAGLFHQGKLGLGELFQYLANDVVARHMLMDDRKFFALVRSTQR